MVTGQIGSIAASDSLRDLVRRYGYGSILIGALLVLWWGVEGPYPIEWVSNGLYVFDDLPHPGPGALDSLQAELGRHP